MSTTTPDEGFWRRLGEALEQLLDADPAQRDELLAALPVRLRDEARAALEVIDARDDGLEQLADTTPNPSSATNPEASLGQQVGGFELLRLIGEGGMAWVYLAERDQGGARQRAALKQLRPDRVTTPLRERFLAEQRIVARLEHPGIARLIAAGVDDDGVPWLATEFIEGDSLLHWCNARCLPLNERLRQFIRVCEAVDAAHRQLTVHRDLKPGNILVDEGGEPRLLDFGISRLLDADDDGEQRTRADWRLLTPEYAAPEQLRGEVPTVAMDIYSLGVVLYELLTGQRPPSALARHDGDDIPAPSQALSDEACRQRGTSSRALARQLRGDIDAIVLHALAVQPEQRYERVSALIEDLRATLQQRPISLRRAHRMHRLLRFLRRNWLACSLAALAVAAILVGVAGVMHESAQRQRSLARAEAVEHFLTNLLGQASLTTQQAAERPVAELLNDGVQEASALAEHRPALAAHLLYTIGTAQDQLDRIDDAQATYDRALDAANSADDQETAAITRVALAHLLLRTPDPSRIDPLLKDSLDWLRRKRPDSPELAIGLGVLAKRHWAKSEGTQSERAFREAIDLLDKNAPEHPEASQLRSDLAVFYETQGRLDEAVAVGREALQRSLETLGADHIQTNLIGFNLAKAMGRHGDWKQADELMQSSAAKLMSIYPQDHSDQAALRVERARLASQLDRLDEATTLLDEALSIARSRGKGAEMLVESIRVHQAALWERKGDLQAAFDTIDDVWRWFAREGHRSFFLACWAQDTSARLLFDLNRDDDANARLAEPSECGAALDEAHARANWAAGRYAEADEAYRRLLAPKDELPRSALPHLALRLRYAKLLRDAGQTRESERQLRRIVAICETNHIESNPDLRKAMGLLGGDAQGS
ncbi:MAG: protein kinase [Xanthomonadales bacterium]|nr:protein kinase [Xanthomonadales bacterium]